MKKFIFIYLYLLGSSCFGQINYKYYTRLELEQDLDFISEKLLNIHPILLDETEHDNWQSKFSEMKYSLKDSMTQNEFYLLAAPLLASLNDGHSSLSMPYNQRIKYSKAGGLAFPFYVDINNYSISNTFYCGNDSTLFQGGEEILEINGISSADMVQEMQKLSGSKSLDMRQSAVAMNFRFYIWMFYGFEKDYEMVIKNNQNQIQTITIPGVSSTDFKRNIKRMPKVDEELFAFSMDPLRSTTVMKIKSFADLAGFCAFADSAFSVINKNKIENLIIDVRGNGGGRSIVVDSLMNYLTDKKYSQYKRIETRISNELKERYKVKYPERLDWINQYAINELVLGEKIIKCPTNNNLRFKGNLFLLIDKTSFSAAATFAGIFKELKLGTIIGEETGGTIEYYGDFWTMKTPNTEISFYVAPKRFIQYGGNDLNRGVFPDYIVANQGDSIIDFTYELIKK